MARSGGSHRRRNMALLVVAAAVASAGVGVVIGKQLKSPADAAAEADAPEPSRITVPVEERNLVSRLVANGDVQYNEPTPLRLAGSVGASAGSAQVVTKVPELDRELEEGDVALEVSGRPVFVFQGALPTYRPLEPGTTGPDVLQLEEALARLGYDTGTVDTVYDDATEAALDALYFTNGYASEGPTVEQRTRLTSTKKAVADASAAMVKAQADLDNAGKPLSGADLLRQQQQLQTARDAVPAAQSDADRKNADAATAVTTATQARDLAKTARDLAKTARDTAAAPGAIDPTTELPYTAVAINALSSELVAKEQALAEAETALRRAVTDQTTTAADGLKAVQTANEALLLAQLSYNEAVAPKDTAQQRDALSAAQAQLAQAMTDQLNAETEAGTKMPAGEMIFLPSLPTTITEVTAIAGQAPPSENVATVSGTTTLIQARISASDADLVKTPTPVDIELRDADISTTGTLVSIEKPKADDGNGNNNGGGDQSDARLTVIVEPDDPALLRDYVGFPARISITVSSTDGDVLAVPVAAISVGPDGDSRVEVERDPSAADGAIEFVKVTVGLSAEGYAEITAIEGASLAAGDRVVVGESTRRSSSDSNDTDTTDASG
jgi:peptidoglycan hydrolase-like protein with peptidoglycan-binding domain